MEKLTFKADGDPRIGTYNEDGSYKAWPEQDAFGKPYERQNATIRRVNASQFIVVGPDQEKLIDSIEFERASFAAPKTQPVLPAKPNE